MTVAEIHDKGEPGNRTGNIVDHIIIIVCSGGIFRRKRNKMGGHVMTEMMEYDDDEYCEDSQQVKVGFSFFQSEGLLSDQEPGLLSLNGKSILERMHSVIVKAHF